MDEVTGATFKFTPRQPIITIRLTEQQASQLPPGFGAETPVEVVMGDPAAKWPDTWSFTGYVAEIQTEGDQRVIVIRTTGDVPEKTTRIVIERHLREDETPIEVVFK